MRKLLLFSLAAVLILPAAALAGRDSPGDGSLVVSSADGKLTVQGKGLIFGHLDHGTITVVDYKPDDNTALPSVSGAKLKLVGGKVVYSGSDVRFLFPGGRYNLIVEGTGIAISAVGNGKITPVAAGTSDDGSLTVDGSHAQPIGATGTATYGKGSSGSNSNSNGISVNSSSSSSRSGKNG
jgi:hypothetical protein